MMDTVLWIFTFIIACFNANSAGRVWKQTRLASGGMRFVTNVAIGTAICGFAGCILAFEANALFIESLAPDFSAGVFQAAPVVCSICAVGAIFALVTRTQLFRNVGPDAFVLRVHETHLWQTRNQGLWALVPMAFCLAAIQTPLSILVATAVAILVGSVFASLIIKESAGEKETKLHA